MILVDTSAPSAGCVVERMREGLRDWNRAGNLKGFELSLSIGVAEWSDGKTLDELRDAADRETFADKANQKMSMAKSAGV